MKFYQERRQLEAFVANQYLSLMQVVADLSNLLRYVIQMLVKVLSNVYFGGQLVKVVG